MGKNAQSVASLNTGRIKWDNLLAYDYKPLLVSILLVKFSLSFSLRTIIPGLFRLPSCFLAASVSLLFLHGHTHLYLTNFHPPLLLYWVLICVYVWGWGNNCFPFLIILNEGRWLQHVVSLRFNPIRNNIITKRVWSSSIYPVVPVIVPNGEIALVLNNSC